MEYRKYDHQYVIRLDPKDEIVTSIREVCSKENIQAGYVQGIGAVNEFEIGLYDLDQQKFIPTIYKEPAEVVSLLGDIGSKDGELYHHFHIACGLKDCRVVGGHLIRAVISATAEIILVPMNGTLNHRVNPSTGLNEFDFNQK